MWYSVRNKVPTSVIALTDYTKRPIVLQKMDEILKKEGITIGRNGEFKNYSPEKVNRAIREAFSSVGLGDFHLHLMIEEPGHLDVRASSPEEAKQKLLRNRKNIMKYCNTSLISEKDVVIEESQCAWLSKLYE